MSGGPSKKPGLPLNPAKKLRLLTAFGKRGTNERPFMCGKVRGSAVSVAECAWFDLVERLTELSQDDFTAVVSAAKLYRRFEEVNRPGRGQ